MTTWTIGEVLDKTFRAFGKSWVALVVGYFVAGVIAATPMILWGTVTIVPMLIRGEDVPPFGSPGTLASMLLAAIGMVLLLVLFAPAMSRMALAAVRGHEVRIAHIFDFRRAGTMLGAGFLTTLAVFGALLLLFVPGIIVGIALSFTSLFVVDSELGAVEAMQASWNATRGHRMHLFGLFVLIGVANFVVSIVLQLTVFLAPIQLALSFVWPTVVTVMMAVIYEHVRPAPQADALQLAV